MTQQRNYPTYGQSYGIQCTAMQSQEQREYSTSPAVNYRSNINDRRNQDAYFRNARAGSHPATNQPHRGGNLLTGLLGGAIGVARLVWCQCWGCKKGQPLHHLVRTHSAWQCISFMAPPPPQQPTA